MKVDKLYYSKTRKDGLGVGIISIPFTSLTLTILKYLLLLTANHCNHHGSTWIYQRIQMQLHPIVF